MRRMCVEPITFLEDGSIPEVEMTSQGAGAPFGPGETVPAWRACLLTGSCCFLPEGDGDTEALARIAPGDSAVFKYFDFTMSPKTVTIQARGSGKAVLYAGETLVSRMALHEGENSAPLLTEIQGKQCIKLVFEEAEELAFLALRFD